MSWQISGNGLGTPVLPGEYGAIEGGFYFEPEAGFDIGTPGSDSYGAQEPDAVHLKSGSIM